MIVRRISLAFAVAAVALVAAAPSNGKLDLEAWRRMPVHHHGRVMPLDTFARSAAEVVCDRMNPELDLKGSASAADYKSDKLAPARELFPDGKPRRFKAAELLLSWLVEPEKWEHVPFLA